MSTIQVQRVVVFQDASRDLSLSAIRWVLQGLSLKPGDELTLVGILHQWGTKARWTVQYLDPTVSLYRKRFPRRWKSIRTMWTLWKSLTNVKKKRFYSNLQQNALSIAIKLTCSLEIKICNLKMHFAIEAWQQCLVSKPSAKLHSQIIFHIEVQVGPCARMVAVKAAKSVGATWVVLDRHMKKDIKFFMERLPCGISRIKRNDTIEELRGPKTIEDLAVSYDEMIPVNVKQDLIRKKSPNPHKSRIDKQQGGDSSGESPWSNSGKSSSSFKTSSSEQHSSSYSTSSLGNAGGSSSEGFTEAKDSPLHFQEEGNTTTTEQETEGEQSPESHKEGHNDNSSSPDEQPKQNENGNCNNDWIGGPDEVFTNSECSICENKRPKIGWKRDFTYAELHAATDGFSDKNFLSEGGFGSVFRGQLDGLKIAVKQHKNASFQGEKEFKSEVHVLSKARHENVVMLLGSCSEGSHRLLVYEYVCNGSLDQHLSKHAREPLSWEKRMKIALESAKGLKYLHDNNIIHRDMRPNNILVTHDHESMLGDFGLARTQHEDSDHSSDTRVVGTLGYLAPEYAECGKVSTKTDVYSFGVVLLQLITGKTTTDKILKGKSLVGWARPLLKQRNYPCLIDKRILDSHDVHQLFWMVRVAEKCLSKDPLKRVTMDNVVCALDNIRQGNTICHMSEFSPAQSDSISSSSHDGSISTDTTSTTKTSQTSESIVSLPPTNIISWESSSSSTGIRESNFGRRNIGKKKRDKPKSRPKICYDSMVE